MEKNGFGSPPKYLECKTPPQGDPTQPTKTSYMKTRVVSARILTGLELGDTSLRLVQLSRSRLEKLGHREGMCPHQDFPGG